MIRRFNTTSILTVGLILALTGGIAAGSYPRQGGFKQLPSHKDPWYYIDHESWHIKAPDKWTHFMGSLAVTEITRHIVSDRTWAGIIGLGLGVIKEVDDAYREGWSRRDLYMDVGGVASSLLLPENLKLLAYYDDQQVMLKLTLTIR